MVACSHGGAAVPPKGWQAVPGAVTTWTTGSGANRQQYAYVRAQFGGTLQDLASAVTIDVLLHYRAARLKESVPFPPCPGAAGVATFTLPNGLTLQDGFTVRNGQSVRTSYIRPSGQPVDPNVTDAMQSALCITPG